MSNENEWDEESENISRQHSATVPTTETVTKKSSKHRYYNGTIAERLNEAKRVTDSLLRHEEVKSVMSVFSYNDQKSKDFQTVYNEAVAANSRQIKEYGDKKGAYDDFEKLFEKIKLDFESICKLAKIALKDNPQKIDQLGLNRKKGKDIASLFNAMQTFFDNAANDGSIIKPLTLFGYSEDRINSCRDLFYKTRDAHNHYYNEHSKAVESTRIRDQKMAILDEWMMDFFKISKIALIQQPELSKHISSD